MTSTTIVPPGGFVLVTGVNGFLGSHIASTLLKQGYKVRGTVRTEEKAAWIKEALASSHSTEAFETVIVPDSSVDGAFAKAVMGVDGIVHVAGDMSFSPDPNKAITPMINSVKNILELAAKEPTVKRFVMTSSNRAVYPPIVNEEITVDQSMWNETAVESAWRPAPYEADRVWDVYAALKTQTEQEIWAFGREAKPNFVINSVLPSFSIGPILHEKQPGSTGKWIMDFWNDPGHSAPLKGFGASFYVDTEDVARLHVAGLTQEDVKNERLFGFAGPFNFNTVVGEFRKLASSKPWPADDPDQAHDLTKFDAKRELELLKRFGQVGWVTFDDSVKRCVEQSL